MRLFTLFSFLSIFFIVNAQGKEIVKIEVSKECSDYVSKRTYLNEVYTKKIDLVSDILHKVDVVFAYSEFRPLIYFNINDYVLLNYNLDVLVIKNESSSFRLTELIDYQKSTTTNALLETVNVYSLGFELSDELASFLKQTESLQIELVRKSNSIKKSWELKPNQMNIIRQSLNCVEIQYAPIWEKYESSLKIFETDFRDAKWGQSQSEILLQEKSNENSIVNNDKSIFIPKTTLNSDYFDVMFHFNNDKLYQGSYRFLEQFVNENNYYNKYKSIRSLLEKKYGTPKEINEIRKGNLFDEPGEIGRAIETGYYAENTIWETKTSQIKLIINGENFKTSIFIVYSSRDKNLMKEVKNENTKTDLKGF